MRPFNPILIAFTIATSVFGQSKEPATTRIHSNDIAAIMHLDGNMFADNQNRGFVAPFKNLKTPSSIFEASLFFAGKDPNSNILISGELYRINFNTGPLFNEIFIPTKQQTNDFNKIWSVNRDEIIAHLRDFNDNGRIDLKLSSIYSWPGKSNPYFEHYNQFLPYQTDYNLAPFFDNNHDGIYNPDDGDYPIVPSVDESVIPSSIHWGIFHKIDNQLRLEISLICWEMECNDKPILNRSFFCSYQISNKSSFEIKESIASIYLDPNLSCFSDDYLGCIPSKNACYWYNGVEKYEDTISICDQGIRTYTQNPPIQTMVFLNRKMDAFITTFNSSFGSPEPNKTQPNNASEFYNYFNAEYKNMEILIHPITKLPTKYQYSDPPSLPNGWSMYAQKIGEVDVSAFSSCKLGNLLPNESKSIDIAYIYHHHPDSTYFQNILLADQQIDEVHAIYSNKFINSCTFQTCFNDCVWPGDTDLDGIVDYLDVVTIFKANNAIGNTRTESWIWKAHESQDWNKSSSSGINYKHCDTNGDGLINKSDIDILNHNLGKTHGNFTQKTEVCSPGKDFYLRILKDTILNSILNFRLIYLTPVKKYQGISFEIKVDPDCATLSQNTFAKMWQDSTVKILNYTELANSNIKRYKQNFVYFSSTGKNEIALDTLDAGLKLTRNNIPTNKTFFDIEICNAKLYLEDGSILPLGSRKQRIYLSPNAVHNIEDAEDPIIFPNPADESVIISNIEEVKSIQLFSIQGVMIDFDNFVFKDKNLDTSRIENGTYILIIKSTGKNYYKKLVIQH
ncbi:MAG: T9SS type A sorting domain-containing protein [Saprospiraceae bacterium]